MRTYSDIINDYLEYLSKKYNDDELLPQNCLNPEQSPIDIAKKSAVLWKEIIDLCYHKEDGLYWFTKFILSDMTYAGYPNKVRFNKLWFTWMRKLSKGDHIAVKCPRQHGKSTFWTVLVPVYRMAMFSNYNVLIESASEDQAGALMANIVRLISNNEFLMSKRSKDAKWSNLEISFNGGIIRARGVGSEVRGGTYDYIVCDDILRSDNKLNDEDIETFIDEELEPMIFVRKGQMVLVGTPKSVTDIFTTIEERISQGTSWQLFHYSAIINWETQEILCPDRFTWEQLMSKLSTMGRLKFDKEFMCNTYSSGSQLFNFDLRQRAMSLGKDWVMYSQSHPNDIGSWIYYMGVDCARAGSAAADWTVCFVIAFNPMTNVKRIVWMWRKKGLKIQEQVSQLAMISRHFDNPVMLVEKNNMGQDFIDLMIDTYNLNVETFVTGGTVAKEDLIRMLIVAFENEKMILPYGDDYSREQVDLLDRELDRFVVEVTKAGNERMKGSGKSHDDMVMALALANRCAQNYGYTPMATTFESNKQLSDLERYAKSSDPWDFMRL